MPAPRDPGVKTLAAYEVVSGVDALRALRRDLQALLERHLPQAEATFDLVLATSEAVANVFRHAYEKHAAGSCRVLVTREPQGLCVTVEDDGTGFDPRWCHQVHAKDESGRGFLLIRGLVDDLRCSRTPSGGARIQLRTSLVETIDLRFQRHQALEGGGGD